MKELEFEVVLYTFDHQEARQRTENGGYHYDRFYKITKVYRFDSEKEAKSFTFKLYRYLKKRHRIGDVTGEIMIGVLKNNFRLTSGNIFMINTPRIKSDVDWWN